RSVVDVHVGAGEQRGRLRCFDERFARLRLSTPLPLAPGDRMVLRSSGAQVTVGGAEVLDVAPARRTVDALARVALPLADRVLAASPWCTAQEFGRLAGRGASPDEAERVGQWLVAPSELERVRTRARALARDGWPAITSVAATCGIEVAQLRAALG